MTGLPARALVRDHRRHPWNLVFAVLGVALGVAIVVAVEIANSSASRAFELSMETITGRTTHQLIGGPGGLDEGLYTRLRREGFRDSAPVVEGHVRIQGETFTLLGLEPFAERPFRDHAVGGRDGRINRLITEPGTVMLAAPTAARLGLAEDETFFLTVGTTPHAVTLVGIVSTDEPGLGGYVLADIATAQDLFRRHGRLDRIDLILTDERQMARLREMLPPGVRLEAAEARTRATAELSRAFHVNLLAMSLLALLVGAFLIYNTLTFAVLRRRHLLGNLRMQGMTRASVFGLIIAEAALLGLVGSLLGLAAGVVIGQGLVQLVTRTVTDLYFVVTVTQLALGPAVILKGLLLGLGVTLIAALGPAWEAAGVSPREALRRSGLEHRVRRVLPWLVPAGGLLMLAGFMLVDWPGQGLLPGFFALFLLILGYACLIPPLVWLMARLLSGPLGLGFGVPGRLAARGIGAGISRSGLAATALAIAVSATVGVGIMVDSFRSSVGLWLGQTLQSDLYVSAPGRSGLGVNPVLPDDLPARVASLPSVAELSTARRVPLYTPRGPLELMAIDPSVQTPDGYVYLEGASPARIWQRLAAEEVILISEPLAWRKGIGVGDSLALPTDRGERTFEVVGVVQDYSAAQGMVTLHRTLYDRYWDDPGVAALRLSLAPGVSLESGLSQLRALAVTLDEPVLITAAGEIHAQSMAIFDRTFAVTHVLRLLTVGVAFIGILSALMALQLERAREHAVLRATGMTPWQLGGMVTLQSLLLGLAAGLAAIPLGILMSDVLIQVINQRSFGWSMIRTLPPAVPGEGLLLALTASLLAGAYPGYRMARVRPAEHLREA
ncbi:FtsX-like permease family protein [Ectothiorhodospira lacustris]|uniref:FtsX-like permease family protein n=1 Tax=Ectothiorhodospira lacustris TaxID=2899127 RepID=UPI001EE962F3|nr:ABC transporter permease [Ectothiorhodospira lacustris]MCG5510297.1 ABC transporter permease [Ectothiorhodospira lacustris]MCG5521836.1 ABC transporter permease [Ectothiorhodospira lacustris]